MLDFTSFSSDESTRLKTGKSQLCAMQCLNFYSQHHLHYARHHNQRVYIFYPIFHGSLYCRVVIVTDNLFTKQGNSSIFGSKIRNLYSRVVSNQGRVIMARVQYSVTQNIQFSNHLSPENYHYI